MVQDYIQCAFIGGVIMNLNGTLINMKITHIFPISGGTKTNHLFKICINHDYFWKCSSVSRISSIPVLASMYMQSSDPKGEVSGSTPSSVMKSKICEILFPPSIYKCYNVLNVPLVQTHVKPGKTRKVYTI